MPFSPLNKARLLPTLLLFPAVLMAAPAAPTLNTPADTARNVATNPTLSWNAVGGATTYRLQVSAAADFSNTLYDQTGIAATSQGIGSVLSSSTISFGTPDGTYGDSRTGTNSQDPGIDQRLQFYRTPGGRYMHTENKFGPLDQFGYIWEGSLSDPTGGGVTGNYSWSWNGISGHQCAWVMTNYQVNPNSADTLLGIIHNETDGQEDGPYPWRLGLAISRNMGRSWTYCGDILKPAGCTTQGSNDYNVAGGVAIKKDGYFYFYFNETPANPSGNDSTYPAVARAPVSEVLAAARNNAVSTWKKYAGGAWNADAFTGRGDRLFTLSYGARSLPDLHESAALVRSTGTYLMGVNAQDAHKLIILASIDGLTWNNEYVLQDATGSVGMCPYGSFVGDSASGASRDQWEQGDSFYFYWNHKRNDYLTDNRFYRSRITVTPRRYYWRVNATDGSGAGAWSTARGFTTTAVIAGGAPPVESATPRKGHSPRAALSVKSRRTDSSRLAVTLALPVGNESSRVSLSLHNMQGRLIRAVTDVSVESGVGVMELDVDAVPAGRYLVRVRTGGVDRTVTANLVR